MKFHLPFKKRPVISAVERLIPPPIRTPNRLESVPTEVRQCLMCVSDLGTLRALVLASPQYAQQFSRDREPILLESLRSSLGVVLSDAYVVYLSSQAAFHQARTRESVTRFLAVNHRGVEGPEIWKIDEPLTLPVAMNMVRFHYKVIIPLTQRYVAWAFENLYHRTGKISPPSRTEELRLMRAFYRFQLCCNLFGAGQHLPPGGSYFTFIASDIIAMFLYNYHPWEVEELICIYAYAVENYEVLFGRLPWELSPHNPNFTGHPGTTFDLHDPVIKYDLIKSTASRGLHLLVAVTREHLDDAELLTIIQENVAKRIGGFLDAESLTLANLRARTNQRRKVLWWLDSLCFKEDRLFNPKRPTDLYPPFAWPLLWKGSPSNLYGYCIPPDLRRWGYIFWDRERMVQSRAERRLHQQWEAMWKGKEPREEYGICYATA
ncbi:hypothetical protein BJY04DRAFT_218551 [Aspergillus karnatakaensis]|uniref:uncharacterized protein n=1 Tax=Aspergillus karnatakaensis TaxID=1810916 RepID=UPI003CCE1CB3